jgi:(1->4)-alpha-D-glucan 1-alpha-D-glucosylmutase
MADGRIKLYVTREVLRLRRAEPGLFTSGEYLPINATGARASNVFAFERRLGRRRALVVVPRLVAGMTREGQLPSGEVWGDTRLPATVVRPSLRNVFTGEEISGQVSQVFGHFPVALFVGQDY